MMRRRYTWAIILALVIVLTVGGSLASSMPLATSPTELLKNGSFEEGFTFQPGCGMVGAFWGCFQNGGTANYGFHDDQWDPVVYDGEHSQLIAIDTKKIGGDPDRYAGIYQTVDVVPGQTYHFSIRGMIRADDHDPDPWRYRVQIGFDHTGGSDWTAVTDWIELPWDTYYPRTAPGEFSAYETTVTAQGTKLTVFIRVWKKWGDWYREVDVNIDAVSLTGPTVIGAVPAAPEPVAVTPPPPPPQPLVCTGPNLLRNGDFEEGFYGWGVGYYWGWFHNDGQASYTFHDDQWDPSVYEGEHAQLIGISTWGLAASDPDRYAGIYQVVNGLEPGAQYELSIAGMMREEPLHSEEDPYRYRVQWGYAPDGELDWTKVTDWQDLPWETVYARTDPGEYLTYSTTFVAPSSQVTIFIRVWKKWPTVGREIDVNLDAITLRRCWPQEAQPADPPAGEPVIYVVKPGDYLARIAARFGTTVQAIVQANGLSNPNLIYVGQQLIIPATVPVPPPSHAVAPPPVATSPPTDEAGEGTVYVVRPGDTLYAIAVRYGVTPYAIAQANGLQNLHWIYPGQQLVIPKT